MALNNKQQHSNEIKAQAMAALLAGQSISYVAEQYKIPRGTVASWSRTLPRNHTVSYEKKQAIGSLILDNVEAELQTTLEMQNVFRDETWLKKQSASELAVLYGVLKDKTFSVIEALPDESEEPAEQASNLS